MKIAVIGTGYVGLVSGTCFAETGNHVICVDNNPAILRRLQAGEVTIFEPGLEPLFARNIEKKRLTFTDDLKSAVLNSEIIFLCLPTPEGENGSADLRYVTGVAGQIGTILKESGNAAYKIIVNKSTVPPGTCKFVAETISKGGGTNFDVVSNPEFLREGFAVEDFLKPDRIVIGTTSTKATRLLDMLYEPYVRQGNPILMMTPESAEVAKYAANAYLAMRITYMNELANYCEKVGADVDTVRKSMGADTRIGKRFLFPGVGYGGSCFPKDVKALIKSGLEHGSEMKILTTVDNVNTAQKHVLVQKARRYFNNELKGRRIAVWGLAFKPNTDDMREAPSVVIIQELLKEGTTVTAYDPVAREKAKFYLNDSITYAENAYDALKDADALMIVTEWNEFRVPDFDIMKNSMRSPVIFDGRNILDPPTVREQGFTYYCIGRP